MLGCVAARVENVSASLTVEERVAEHSCNRYLLSSPKRERFSLLKALADGTLKVCLHRLSSRTTQPTDVPSTGQLPHNATDVHTSMQHPLTRPDPVRHPPPIAPAIGPGKAPRCDPGARTQADKETTEHSGGRNEPKETARGGSILSPRNRRLCRGPDPQVCDRCRIRSRALTHLSHASN